MESRADESKKSQLLSLDGWDTYQKELTRLCFELWEVNEKQLQVNNIIQSDLVSESAEMQLPTSLFVDENIKNQNTVGFESNVSLDNTIISKQFKNNESEEINRNVFNSKHEDDPVARQFARVMNNDCDWRTHENSSKIVNFKGNERSKRKILKKFSLYKHSSKQVKPNNKQQSLTLDRYSSCTLKDCKKWLDTVEKIKKHNPDAIFSENIEKNVESLIFDERSDSFVYNPLDTEAKKMERKVKKLVKSINEKDKLFTNTMSVDEQSAAKSGPSNKFKYFLKNVFQGNHDELELQLLNDYTEYINQKLNTWRTLLERLDGVRQKMSCAGTGTREDVTNKNGSCSVETNKEPLDCRLLVRGGYCNNDESERSKFVETNEGFGGDTSRQKKYNFFKLINKTKRSVDMRTAVCKRTGRNSVGDFRMDNNNYQNNVNNFCGSSTQWSEKPLCGRCISSSVRLDVDGETQNHCAELQHADGRIRKSFSDTDLSSMRPRWQRCLLRDHVERSAVMTTAGKRTTRIGWETLRQAETYSTTTEPDRNDTGRVATTSHRCSRDDVARRLWEDRQECFRSVVARLEYVGSTFREPCRLAGLRTLCKVDVLAGFGRPAEAVDLFVQSALPLSENPDLMIRKAEAAYDWKFFCHLSMWRHSYKE